MCLELNLPGFTSLRFYYARKLDSLAADFFFTKKKHMFCLVQQPKTRVAQAIPARSFVTICGKESASCDCTTLYVIHNSKVVVFVIIWTKLGADLPFSSLLKSTFCIVLEYIELSSFSPSSREIWMG